MPELHKVRSATRWRTRRLPLWVSRVLSLKLSLISCSTNSVPLTHLPALIPVFSTQCDCWALLGSRLPSLQPESCHWVENSESQGSLCFPLFTFSGNSVHVSKVLNLLHVYIACVYNWGFPSVTALENPVCWCRRHRCDSWVKKIPWHGKWLPTPVVLTRESQGQRSLVGYSPWGRKELDMTERLRCSIFHWGYITLYKIYAYIWMKYISSLLLI